MVHCVVFDLDGTLVKLGDLFYRIFADVIRANGLEPVQFDTQGEPWAGAHGQTVAIYPQLRDVADEALFADTWEHVLREMLAEGSLGLYPGVRTMLDRIRASGRRMCLASNTPKRFVQIKLDVLDIRGFFDAIFTPQDQWGRKPRPESLFHVANLLDLQPNEIVMVGDHWVDVSYGKNAGAKTIGVLNEFNSREVFETVKPDSIVSRIDEVTDILDSPAHQSPNH